MANMQGLSLIEEKNCDCFAFRPWLEENDLSTSLRGSGAATNGPQSLMPNPALNVPC